MNNDFTYDAVAYPSMVFPRQRPDRVAALAVLHGMALKDIGRSRVLELGCGDGMTLLSTACSMPESEFLGIDLSAPRIEEAKSYAAELGLTNIRFEKADILDLEKGDLGVFDFIFAHGLFSWVPAVVREKTLDLYQSCLSSGGVGLISYNTCPGFHMRSMVRDAMRYQVRDVGDPDEKTSRGLSFVKFLASSVPAGTAYGELLQNEVIALESKTRQVLFHDDLAEINQPFYFHEFAALLEGSGLRYLAELDPSPLSTHAFSDDAKKALEELREQPVEREQLIDLLRCTRFRSSLVCRQGEAVSYRAIPAAVRQLYLAARIRPVLDQPCLADDSEVAFAMPGGVQFSTNHTLSKTALGLLGKQYPARLSFDEIETEIRTEFEEQSGYESEIERLTEFLLELIESDIIEASSFRPAMTPTITDRPVVSTFARWQAIRGSEYVTNPNGESTRLENDLMRALIISMDGSAERHDLPAALEKFVDFPDSEKDRVQRGLLEMVENFLPAIRDAGLLVG